MTDVRRCTSRPPYMHAIPPNVYRACESMGVTQKSACEPVGVTQKTRDHHSVLEVPVMNKVHPDLASFTYGLMELNQVNMRDWESRRGKGAG